MKKKIEILAPAKDLIQGMAAISTLVPMRFT